MEKFGENNGLFPLSILMDDLGKIHYFKETPNSTQGIKLKKGYTPED